MNLRTGRVITSSLLVPLNDRQKTRLRRLNVFSVFTVLTVLFHGIGSKITEYFCFDFLYGKNKTATILNTSCHTLITVHTKIGHGTKNQTKSLSAYIDNNLS